MNPKKLGKLDNHDQEPWKLRLPEFIVRLYAKRFGKERPDAVRTIEEMAAARAARQQAKKAANDVKRMTQGGADDAVGVWTGYKILSPLDAAREGAGWIQQGG